MQLRRTITTLPLLSLCLFSSASAGNGGGDAWAADASIDLRFHEVCPVHLQGVVDESSGAWFELYNPHDVDIPTSNLQIADENLLIVADLPSIVLPPGSYLVISLGEGVDDVDARDDGRAAYHLRRSAGIQMSWESGALALFRGRVGNADCLRDFVAWGTHPLEDSPALSLALKRNLWKPDLFVDLDRALPGSSFGLAAPGMDARAAGSWAIFSGRYDSALPTPGRENQLMAFPRPGEVRLTDTIDLGWSASPVEDRSTSVLVRVDRWNEQGVRTTVVAKETDSRRLSIPTSAGGKYVWRVDRSESGAPSPVFQEASFYRPARIEGPRVDLGVPFLENQKDTEMLCAYDISTSTRPGCDDTHWNVPHAPETANEHDVAYSARASIAMINHYYGGDLSQDRISYEVFKSRYPGAEGDLGHGIGLVTGEITAALRWALGGASTQFGSWAPPFDYVREHLDSGRPILVTTTLAPNARECAVISGYVIFNLYSQGPPMPAVHLLDPRAGADYWILYSFFAPTIMGYWGITGTPSAILQEGAVTDDSDGDGIVDFDESPIYDRFGSSATEVDTDVDEIPDFLEAYCYTFHDAMHAGHSNDGVSFPDVDGDGMRAEADVDSDGGGVEDGSEDLDHDGVAPESGETCPLLASDDVPLPMVLTPRAAINREQVGLSVLQTRESDRLRFRFQLPRNERVSLVVFAPDGRICARLLEEEVTAGTHEIAFDGNGAVDPSLPSGIYLARLSTRSLGDRAVKFAYVR